MKVLEQTYYREYIFKEDYPLNKMLKETIHKDFHHQMVSKCWSYHIDPKEKIEIEYLPKKGFYKVTYSCLYIETVHNFIK